MNSVKSNMPGKLGAGVLCETDTNAVKKSGGEG